MHLFSMKGSSIDSHWIPSLIAINFKLPGGSSKQKYSNKRGVAPGFSLLRGVSWQPGEVATVEWKYDGMPRRPKEPCMRSKYGYRLPQFFHNSRKSSHH